MPGLGGDLSLVEDIRKRHAETTEEEREAFLEGTGFEGAQAVVPTDVHVRRYEAETARMEEETKRIIGAPVTVNPCARAMALSCSRARRNVP